jgi:hypothetical protein
MPATHSFGRPFPAERTETDEARQQRTAALRLVDVEVEDDCDEEDQAAGGVDPGAGQAGRN